MKRRPAILAVLLGGLGLAAALPRPAAAAEPRWRQIGPDQRGVGQVTALAIDPSRPSRLFAGLEGGGIARSGDGGRTWRTMTDGLTSRTVYSIVLHPALDRLVYATGGGAIFRSLNDGRTWVPLPLQGAHTVAPDPCSADDLFPARRQAPAQP